MRANHWPRQGVRECVAEMADNVRVLRGILLAVVGVEGGWAVIRSPSRLRSGIGFVDEVWQQVLVPFQRVVC